MNNDNELKSTLEEVVLYAVSRIESCTDAKTRRSIFYEYKEWLGNSIDDWVLSLPNDWEMTERNL